MKIKAVGFRGLFFGLRFRPGRLNAQTTLGLRADETGWRLALFDALFGQGGLGSKHRSGRALDLGNTTQHKP